MLNEIFKNKFEFAYNYFSTLLEAVFENKRKFPQAIIFEGSNTKEQYLFALELARLLNCQKDKSKNCSCTNCKWIRNYTHPAVNLVSQLHFKPEDDETKTLISTKQAKEIEKNLTISSDYHRFFIFISSKEYNYNEDELKEFEKLGYNTDINYSIEPVNYKTFHQATLNALLKSIEEPPVNTTFIFLAKSKEDIIQTIASRCLVFKLSASFESLDFNDIQNIIPNYFDINYNNIFDITDKLQSYIKESNQTLEAVLNKFIAYLNSILKNNLSKNDIVLKIYNDINLISYAIKQSKANMSDKIVLENLFLKILRGY